MASKKNNVLVGVLLAVVGLLVALVFHARSGIRQIDEQLEQIDEIQTFADQKLEEPHRSIFHLRFDEDLTIAEIAQRLDMNPNTTYKYLIQCIQQIRHHFKR